MPVLHAAPNIAPQIVVLGFALGLRADVLLAGFAGSLVALAFFNAVPSTGDTLAALVRDTFRRTAWCLASALTAGYITPLVLLIERDTLRIPDSLTLSMAFVVGAGAQHYLGRFIKREPGTPPPAAPTPAQQEGS